MELIAFMLGMISYHHFYPVIGFLCLFFTQSLKQLLVCIIMMMIGFCSFKDHHERIKSQSFNFSHNFFSSFLIEIQGFEERKSYGKRWKVKIKKPHEGVVWLNCYQNCPRLLPGQTWWVQGQFKKIINFQNPGQYNIWYRQDFRHVVGQINLNSERVIQEKDISSWDILNQIRVKIYLKAQQAFNQQHQFAQKVFLTLVLGIGSELSQEDWNVFKDTGTAHLMVVSGAHLGLLMLLVGWLVDNLYRICPWSCPVKKISSGISLGLGLIYALISGFGIPVQRAWIMKFLMDIQYFVSYRVRAFQAFRFTIFVILLIEPHALFYPGAYLSFLAVGILMLTPRLFTCKTWVMHILTQAMCLIGLSPLTVLWFSSIPSIGFFANLIAIPWVSWLVLPLALSMFVFIGPWGVQVFDWSLQVLDKTLHALQSFDFLNIHLTWHNPWMPWVVLFALLVNGIFQNVRVLVASLLICWMLNTGLQSRIGKGEFFVDVLDVGQGLSVLVRTSHHALLYDTAGMQGHRSFASFVVLPYLKYIELNSLDALVLSHPDLDHIAGRQEILAQYPKAQFIVDQPSFYHQGQNCRKMKDWCWDEVCFHFLKGLSKTKKKNDHSCVLLVNNQKYQILLTGDIEKKAENAIIKQEKNLHPTVLLVPHHGSKTSSSINFLQAMQTKLAVVSVALYNSYHLPHPLIQKRYEQLKIPWITTAQSGWIQIQFFKNSWKTKNYKS
jgi:competence protein ComEC